MFDAIAFATGATLSAMLGLMQWRVDRASRRTSGYLILWTLGFVWTFGNFLRNALALGGVPPDAVSVRFAETFAWSCTLLGPIAMERLLRGGVGDASPGAIRATRALFTLTVGVSLLNLALLVRAGVVYDWRIERSAYPTTSFFIALAVGIVAVLLYIANRPARPATTPRWFLPAAFGLAMIHTVAILLTTTFTNLPDGLLAAAGLIGQHWTIPWSILIAVSLAQAHYADVILKRSLWLVTCVIVATIVGTTLADVLVIGAAMLAAPLIVRAIGALVDRVVLARPDYAEAGRALDTASRRATEPAQLVDAAVQSVRTTLRVDARWDDAVRKMDVTVSHHARRLMQPELAFLDSVGTQLAHRLDALQFQQEQRALHLREERLKRLLTEAELKALRTQVDPHFLFNTLNTIADLIGSNPEQAERMTERLAECFRYALATDSRDMSTLAEELDFARQYLGIEQVRFGDRLRVDLSLGDASGREAVPSLLLQPLLENAIRHGLAPVREGGCVTVRATCDGDRLRLSVEDDGVGMRPGSTPGVGLRNVQERLRTLYAQAAECLIGERPDGRGTRITIVIPRHAD